MTTERVQKLIAIGHAVHVLIYSLDLEWTDFNQSLHFCNWMDIGRLLGLPVSLRLITPEHLT